MDDQIRKDSEQCLEIVARRYCDAMGFDPNQIIQVPQKSMLHDVNLPPVEMPLWQSLLANAKSTIAWYHAISPFI